MITEMREYIEEHGWHQGDLWDAEGRAVCLQGSFVRLYKSHSEDLYSVLRKKAGGKLAEAIRELYPDFRCCPYRSCNEPWHLVVRFNDDVHTTCEDVMRVLKHAERGA